MGRDATKGSTWASRFGDWFDASWWFPPTCPTCGEVAAADRLCPPCDLRVFAPPAPSVGETPCGTRVDALAWFEGDVRSLLLRLKFGRDTHAACAFGPRLAARAADLRSRFDAIVPMPLSLPRRCVRGFNQAEVIARLVGHISSKAVDSKSLIRRGNTGMHRVAMDRTARNKSVEDIFSVVRPKMIDGKHVTLIDDVLTSGATLSACAEELKKAGASRVTAFTIARTR